MFISMFKISFAQNEQKMFWALNQCQLFGSKLSVKPTAAYSLRKLFCNYAGYAVNVRRDVDNATQDIGFTPKGDLDTNNLKTFITPTSVTISYSATYIGAPGGTYNTTNIPVPGAISISSITAISGMMNGASISGDFAFTSSQQTITSGQSIIVGFWDGTNTKMAKITFTFSANNIAVIQVGSRYQGGDQTANLVNAYNNGTGFSGYNVHTLSLTISGTFNSSAYVTKWYDQSGNGRDVSQATASQQPRIANAGAVEKSNGKASVLFISANQTELTATLSPSALFTSSYIGTASLVLEASANNTSAFGYSNSTQTNRWQAHMDEGGILEFDCTNTSNTASVRTSYNNAANANQGVLRTYALVANSASPYQNIYISGSSVATGTTALGSTNSTTNFQIGGINEFSTYWHNNHISEAIFYNQALSSAMVSTINSNQKAYYGTP